MLLSGQVHKVVTGVCFYNFKEDSWFSAHDSTKVFFRNLSENEIDEYIKTGEPMDKAGAYGIQGLGGEFVKSYEGSWTNVVGLPMELVKKIIKEQEWEVA